jgi:adenylate kinase
MLVTLFGPPGSGKSAVGDFLHREQAFLHLPIGRLLKTRSFIDEIGINADEMNNIIATGKTVSSRPLFDWLDSTILKGQNGVVVDGYPREPSALPRFCALVEHIHPRRVIIALHLECSLEFSTQRVLTRGRSDDTPELAATRYEEYETKQRPLLGRLPNCVRLETLDASSPDLLQKVARIIGVLRRQEIT